MLALRGKSLLESVSIAVHSRTGEVAMRTAHCGRSCAPSSCAKSHALAVSLHIVHCRHGFDYVEFIWPLTVPVAVVVASRQVNRLRVELVRTHVSAALSASLHHLHLQGAQQSQGVASNRALPGASPQIG
jgi:hypothetical protein